MLLINLFSYIHFAESLGRDVWLPWVAAIAVVVMIIAIIYIVKLTRNCELCRCAKKRHANGNKVDSYELSEDV